MYYQAESLAACPQLPPRLNSACSESRCFMDDDAVYLLAAGPFPSSGQSGASFPWWRFTASLRLALASASWTPAPLMSLVTLFLVAN
jgi:hypothetical protein